MDCRGRLLAQALATRLDLENRHRVLDVAGGSGIYACALAARFPKLRASVFEKPPVDRIAARAIETRGYSERVERRRRRHADRPAAGRLRRPPVVERAARLGRAHREAAAARVGPRRSRPGARSSSTTRFLNADKSGPLQIAGYSVLLMHVTQGRCYSVAEMSAWLVETGFSTPREVPSAVGRSALVATKVLEAALLPRIAPGRRASSLTLRAL